MIGYVKYFERKQAMICKVIDKKILKTYTKIQERVGSLMNIEFDSEPVYGDNKKYIKAYGDKVNVIFQGKKMPKKNASDKYLLLIMLHSVIKI